jgi:addiction module HigA family antidote
MPTTSKSRITTSGGGAPALVQRRLPTHRPPTHPGEMLLEEFLKPLGISQSAFAIQLGVSFPRLNEVINAKRRVTPDTALRLAQVTGGVTAVRRGAPRGRAAPSAWSSRRPSGA